MLYDINFYAIITIFGNSLDSFQFHGTQMWSLAEKKIMLKRDRHYIFSAIKKKIFTDDRDHFSLTHFLLILSDSSSFTNYIKNIPILCHWRGGNFAKFPPWTFNTIIVAKIIFVSLFIANKILRLNDFRFLVMFNEEKSDKNVIKIEILKI